MLSVIIASHNGSEVLPLTLEALTRVRFPKASVEFIAVDNASSDETPAILDRYRERLPLNVLSEPRKGKSFALNGALDAAKGDLIVFADDDVIPADGWLEAFSKAADDHPEADLFAGQVRHYWQRRPPSWLLRLANEGLSYAGTPLDQAEGPVKPGFFKGPNFMVRSSVVEALRFSENPRINFGARAGTSGGEDTIFVQQAAQAGHGTYYVPDACVQHIVRPHQVGFLPVFRRYVRIGHSMAMDGAKSAGPEVARIFGYPRFVFRSIPVDVLRACRLWLSGNSYAAARELLDVAVLWGTAVHSREEHLESQSK